MPASSAVRYRTLTSLVAAAGLAYLCRNAVGVAESTIRSDLGLSVKQSGVFLGAFFWTYAIFQIPSGIFAQRFGTRIALTMFASLWAIATLGIAGATSFWPLIAAQLVMGVAQAGIFPASCQSIRHWMPMAQRALACGLLAAGMQIGAVVASGLTGELIEITSWRWIFVFYALPCLVWSVGFFMFFRDRPEESLAVSAAELKLIRGKPDESSGKRKVVKSHKQAEHDESRKESTDSISWLAIVRSTTVWFLCGQQICRAAGYMFFASWFPTFLQETRGISVRDSGYLQGLVLLGTLAGGIVGGWLVDWVWRRTHSLRYSRSGLSAGCLTVCGLLILAAWFVTSLPLAIGLLAVGALFAALAGPGAFSTTIDIGGTHTPQVFGLMNMSGNFAAAACPIFVGWLFDWTSNWNIVLVVFAAIYLLGAVCWMFVDPSRELSDPSSRLHERKS